MRKWKQLFLILLFLFVDLTTFDSLTNAVGRSSFWSLLFLTEKLLPLIGIQTQGVAFEGSPSTTRLSSHLGTRYYSSSSSPLLGLDSSAAA